MVLWCKGVGIVHEGLCSLGGLQGGWWCSLRMCLLLRSGKGLVCVFVILLLLYLVVRMLSRVAFAHMESRWRHVSVSYSGWRAGMLGGLDDVFSLIAHVLIVSYLEGLCGLGICALGVDHKIGESGLVGFLSPFATYGYWGCVMVVSWHVYSLCM